MEVSSSLCSGPANGKDSVYFWPKCSRETLPFFLFKKMNERGKSKGIWTVLQAKENIFLFLNQTDCLPLKLGVNADGYLLATVFLNALSRANSWSALASRLSDILIRKSPPPTPPHNTHTHTHTRLAFPFFPPKVFAGVQRLGSHPDTLLKTNQDSLL